ncbi:hypothetical protein [Rhizobium sp. Root1203]|uniref:hypothetical protein n=1 Tax=Rhizobium sp. Root1203 TaxID=1736427 RepID=UPI0012E39608|nr:hypothetical protein [Rhizobium sp. Root1203]
MLPLKLYAFEIVLALDLIIGGIVLNFAPGRYAGAALQGDLSGRNDQPGAPQ